MESQVSSTRRTARESTPSDVIPASQFLQERLQERRARNTRPKRARQSDFGPRNTGRDDDIFLDEAEESRYAGSRAFDSSPLTAVPQRNGDSGLSSSHRRGLGARDLDDHMDRLTKQNFALKLELDHRREHNTKLQEQIQDMKVQVERAEQLELEHAELLRINTQLVEELEKRDKAVEEAMDIICDLEDKVVDMEERNSNTRPSTANADSGYAGTETHEQAPPSSPPELNRAPKTPHVPQRQPPPSAKAAAGNLLSVVTGPTPARPRREPNILSQKKASTHALRSVYLETAQSLHPVQSFNSLLTRQESKIGDDEATLDSPRLSVLSESSFPSIYSPKGQVSPDRFAWEAGEDGEPHRQSSHFRQDSIKRVSQWMDDRDQVEETPSKSKSVSPPVLQVVDGDLAPLPSKRPVDTTQFPSIANALSRESKNSVQLPTKVQPGVSYIKPYPLRTERNLAKKQPRPYSLAGPIFGEPLLPPTPDSASTRMLRGSRSSVIAADNEEGERSLLDITPQVVKGYDALEPDVRTAPKQFRSSVELSSAFHNYSQRCEEEEEDDLGDRVRDLSLDYDGFPDGGSIILGTPSRFLKRAPPPIPIQRRQSSLEATAGPRKPSLSKAETSPATALPGYDRMAGGVTSPRSYHSGSSGNRTVIQNEDQNHTSTPELQRSIKKVNTSLTASAPTRTLSQKAQALFGNKVNTNTKERERSRSPRERSPLPTLTSTPSSAYINEIPKEARRPGTSQSTDHTNPRPPTSNSVAGSGRRVSLTRMNTAPTSPSSGAGERKNFFKRRSSVRASVEAQTQTPPTTGMGNSVVVQASSEAGKTKRRGSFREAVGSAASASAAAVGSVGRRAWR